MARRKKSADGGIVLLFFVIVFLVFLTFVIGAAIVVFWLFREMTLPKRIATLREAGFEPSLAEQTRIQELEQEKLDFEAQTDAIMAEGSHLSRRKDGYFHERSTMGKTLNARLQPALASGKRAEQELAACRQAPHLRRSECDEPRATMQSTRAATLCLAAAAATVMLLEPAWAAGFGNFVMDNGLWLPALDPNIYASAIVSTWCAVAVYFVWRFVARAALEAAAEDAG